MEIAKTQLSQNKFVHTMEESVPPISVSTSEISELWTRSRFNCEDTFFRKTSKSYIRRIAQETIDFIFYFRNICIQYVKQSGNNTANRLVRLFVSHSDCIVGWEFVSAEFRSNQ